MPKRLTDLTIKEGSFCRAGMNPQAKVLLFKVADQKHVPLTEADLAPLLDADAPRFLEKMGEVAQTFSEITDNEDLLNRLNSKIWTLQESVHSILRDADAEPLTLLQQSLNEFSTAVLDEAARHVTKAGRKISAKRMQQLRSALTALQAIMAEQEEGMAEKKTKKELAAEVDAAFKVLPESYAALWKATPEDQQEEVRAVLLAAAEIVNTQAEQQAQLDKAAAELTAAQEQVAALEKALEKKDPAEEEEDLLKGLPEPLRKRLEAAEAKAAEAEEVAKAERDARQLQEYTKQAETDMPHLPTAPAEKGRLLKVLADRLEKADFDHVVTLFKAGSEAILQALKITGEDVVPTGETAYGKIEAIAAQLQAKDSSLTKQQALSKAINDNPDLYGAHLRERQLSA